METEQRHVDLLYRLLDRQRRRVTERKRAAQRENDGTPSGLFTRDVLQFRYAEQLAQLAAAEDKLCFGRLDLDGADGPDHTRTVHIGRIGIADDTGEREQVLVDWRAPFAAPFYTATALDPKNVVRRRHIRTTGRAVTDVSDEYLQTPADGHGPADADAVDTGIGGDGALLEALKAPRTGRMGDIIETIQAEQDAIIRADRSGVLVVQGGPGTGKTVVALHRAAYLLYTHRARLGSHGVLVVGPSRTFLNYIGAVLPSLGETSVVLTTIGGLLPGIEVTADDEPAAAALKGSLGMVQVLDNALLYLQRLPRRPLTVPYDRGTVTLDPALLRRARRRAWASRRPHNRARAVFVRAVLADLARQVAERPGVASLDPDAVVPDTAAIAKELAADAGVATVLAGIWPLITPQQFVRQLLADKEWLAFAAPMFSAADRAALHRSLAAPLTVSDVPLIDEATELLGEVSPVDRARAAQLAEEMQFAKDTLQALGAQEAAFSDDGIGFTLSMLSAGDIAALHDTSGPVGSVAERASAERSWTYGHVVVDEAQELSAMAWRAIFRRCPLKSMTIVGDTAQTSAVAGSATWARALDPHAKGRWSLAELTVNYRTPAEIMDLAAPVLAAIDPTLTVPSSVRSAGERPWTVAVSEPSALSGTLADLVADEAAQMPAGQLAVLHAGDQEEVLAAIRQVVPDAVGEAGPHRRVVVLPVREAKGLEFDRVILAEPAAIVADGPHGLSDLYVAITRATQRLGLVHAAPLPPAIDPALLQPRA